MWALAIQPKLTSKKGSLQIYRTQIVLSLGTHLTFDPHRSICMDILLYIKATDYCKKIINSKSWFDLLEVFLEWTGNNNPGKCLYVSVIFAAKSVLKHILGPEIIIKGNTHLSYVTLWTLFFQGYSGQKYYQNLPERAPVCLIPWIPHHQWWPSGKSKGLHRGHSVLYCQCHKR